MHNGTKSFDSQCVVRGWDTQEVKTLTSLIEVLLITLIDLICDLYQLQKKKKLREKIQWTEGAREVY